MANGENVRVTYLDRETETSKAVLYQIGVELVWIPKSQISHRDVFEKHIWIPLWLAEKLGIDYE